MLHRDYSTAATSYELNVQNDEFGTFACSTFACGSVIVCFFLCIVFAPVNAKTNRGLTPLDYAMGKQVVAQLPVPHESTVALIRKLGGNEGVNLKP